MNDIICTPACSGNTGLNIGADGEVYNGDMDTGYNLNKTHECYLGIPIKTNKIEPNDMIPFALIEAYGGNNVELFNDYINIKTQGVYAFQMLFQYGMITHCDVITNSGTTSTISAYNGAPVIITTSEPNVKVKVYDENVTISVAQMCVFQVILCIQKLA